MIRHALPAFAAALAAASLGGCQGEARLPDEAERPALSAVPQSPITRCMNLSNALEAPVEGAWGYRVRAQDLVALSEAGFDTVRLPVKVSAHTGPAPEFLIAPQLLDRLDTVIGQALAAGLNIILDVHHFDEIYDDPDAETPHLEAIWRQLGARYAGAPEGLIFEVLNEPRGALTPARTAALNRALLAQIRQTNPGRWVILSPSDWSSLPAWLGAEFPREAGVITSFHYYAPYEFTHQGASWLETPPIYSGAWGDDPGEIAEVRGDFARARQKALADGLPVLVGEFGAHVSNAPGERAAWLQAVRTASEAAGFGWCHWGFAAEFGAYDPALEAWRPGVLDALALTPRADPP
ncbi:MAG: glycoside hydrolase family 5 protein [Pseudomonadota bacterium]